MIRLLAVALLALPLPAMAQEVSERTATEADGSRTLTHELVVAAPAAEVWTAISTAEGWKSWAVPVAWAPDANTIETSYTPTATLGDASTIRQTIIARLPGRLLIFRTVKAPQGFPHFETYAGVTSFFELEPVDSGKTRVRLTQTGYPANEAGTTLLGFFRTGNRQTLEALRDRFVTGPIDWSKRMPAKKGVEK